MLLSYLKRKAFNIFSCDYSNNTNPAKMSFCYKLTNRELVIKIIFFLLDKHVVNIWETFKMNTIVNYHDLHLQDNCKFYYWLVCLKLLDKNL